MLPLPYSRSFPTPAFLARHSFALDISDQSIKYGELVMSPYGLHLGRFGKEKIAPGVIMSGKIEEEEALIEILRSLRLRENMHFVRVSLPEEQMYLFTLSLPQVKDVNLRDAIMLQLEEHIPIPAIETTFDYKVISETETTIFVSVVAIANAVVESYLSVFHRAGLVPLSFELEAEAIARAVVPFDDPSPVMIIDLGQSKTGVLIAERGNVLFTTTLDIGGATLTNMIAKNFGISSDEAEKMKRSYGIDEANEKNDILPVIANGISVLHDEINKHHIYWQTHSENGEHRNPINNILLCGEGSNLSGIEEYLQASMMMKVTHAHPWVNISHMDITVPDISFEESLGYVTVLGLSLGDYHYD